MRRVYNTFDTDLLSWIILYGVLDIVPEFRGDDFVRRSQWQHELMYLASPTLPRLSNMTQLKARGFRAPLVGYAQTLGHFTEPSSP